ncbi:MAG TPA: hypothetical protein VIX86_19170 [Streptosporangiaceae bacterium]
MRDVAVVAVLFGGEIRFGTGCGTDFTPTELLLAAIGGCTPIDVDILTSRLAQPDSCQVQAKAVSPVTAKIRISVVLPIGEKASSTRQIGGPGPPFALGTNFGSCPPQRSARSLRTPSDQDPFRSSD